MHGKKNPPAPILNPFDGYDAKKIKKAWADVLKSNFKKDNTK